MVEGYHILQEDGSKYRLWHTWVIAQESLSKNGTWDSIDHQEIMPHGGQDLRNTFCGDPRYQQLAQIPTPRN